MTEGPDLFGAYRTGRLGRVPAFASPADPHRLLAAVAEALNACERAGLIVDADCGALSCRDGFVIPVGDGRLGSRWAARMMAKPGSSEDEQPAGPA